MAEVRHYQDSTTKLVWSVGGIMNTWDGDHIITKIQMYYGQPRFWTSHIKDVSSSYTLDHIIKHYKKTNMSEALFNVGDEVVVSIADYHTFKDGIEGLIIGVKDYGAYIIKSNNKQQIIFSKDLKPKTMNISKQTMKLAVETVANFLMKRDGNITTLPLKNELRVQYPSALWNQYSTGRTLGVTELFHELVGEGKFKSVGDNGTYQTYVSTAKIATNVGKLAKAIAVSASKSRGLVKGSATAKAAGAKAAATRLANKGGVVKGNVISRTKALDLIKNSKGSFITVEFIKKDGSERTLNGQYSSTIQPNIGLGLITLRENIKAKLTPKDSLRQFDINKLKSLKIKGVTYKIK